MPDHDILLQPEASDYTRIPAATLKYWRHRGTGPRSFRLGRRIAYRRQDLDAWLAEQVLADRTSTGGAA
ncbi:helix-turn-helix transcriptional regulator [Kineococcus terrestris]|uniref:helix-turn-helix transcriptional regulator n=1 Tax=Kineococcus terrestris TaxID=2044856 RepID=UPI0034DB3D70